MKLWKKAIFAFILLSAAICLLLIITMVAAGSAINRASAVSVQPSTIPLSPPPSSSSSSSSSSSPRSPSHRRVARASEDRGSFLPEFSYLFQHFSEAELRRVIRSLVDSKVGRRIKREKTTKACLKHKLNLTVSELGLGYESDETVSFHYCKGKCTRHLGNYDMVLRNVILNKASDKDLTTRGGTTKTERMPHSRCCRPIKYDNMSFFDSKANKFFTIQDVSARKCGCV